MPTADEQKDGKFYFYNPLTVAYGKQQFEQYWGDRKLEDNWRWSAMNNSTIPNLSATTTTQQVAEKEVDTPDNYLSKLPKTEAEISKLTADRNEALYQLGVLYRAKFSENELAIQRLERLLSLQPTADLEVVALYELQKNYTDVHNPKAESIKEKLLANYSGTDYAKLLQGGETTKQEQNKLAQQFLDSLTAEYNQNEIVAVAERLQNEAINYRETALAPKIALLQAKTTARLEGITAYQQQLQQLVTNYPATAESEEAKNLLEELKDIEKETFVTDDNATSWKVIITGTTSETRAQLKDALTEKLQTISASLSLSADLYNAQETWWVIHHLRDAYTAHSLIEELKDFLAAHKLSAKAVPTENYRLIQIRKEKLPD